jgi:hypothetical protein
MMPENAYEPTVADSDWVGARYCLQLVRSVPQSNPTAALSKTKIPANASPTENAFATRESTDVTEPVKANVMVDARTVGTESKTEVTAKETPRRTPRVSMRPPGSP